MDHQKRALITMHICVLLWGFTAILGALISLQSLPLVLWRVVLSGLMLAIIVARLGYKKLPTWVIWQLVLIGFFVGIHWLAFYGAIKIANASIGVVSISTASFFTAIFEPFLIKKRVNWNEVLLGLLIVPAIGLIVGQVNLQMQQGLWLGIFAAALVGVFASLTKRLLTNYPELPVVQASMIQMWVIAAQLILVLPLWLHYFPDLQLMPGSNKDWWYLFVFASMCTVVPFTLSIYAQRNLSTFTSTLILNLEPVYGVILAVLVLREDKDLNIWFYLGVFLLFAIVFGHSVFQRYSK
jgi:drug/metabolite transporter (DMT)-like permease